jgi:hypothetical protein
LGWGGTGRGGHHKKQEGKNYEGMNGDFEFQGMKMEKKEWRAKGKTLN